MHKYLKCTKKIIEVYSAHSHVSSMEEIHFFNGKKYIKNTLKEKSYIQNRRNTNNNFNTNKLIIIQILKMYTDCKIC